MAQRRATPQIVLNSRARANSSDPPLYGLDAELARKAAAKFDPQLEAEALQFLERVTGRQKEAEQSLADFLHDGTVLCEAVNAVRPGSVRRVNRSKMPFKQMENISNFSKACRQLGLHEADLFTTVALYEAKDMLQVVSGIVAFGRLAQKLGYEGATLGPKEAKANKRSFTLQQLRSGGGGGSKFSSHGTMEKPTLSGQSRAVAFATRSGAGAVGGGMSKLMAGSSQTMERRRVVESGIAFGAKASGAGTAGMSRLMAGSAGTAGMRANKAELGRDITAAAAAGAGAGGMSKLLAGSSQTMQRSEVSRSGIAFGAAAAGKPTSGGTTLLNAGSSNVMERTHVTKSGIAFGAQASGSGTAGGVSRWNLGSAGVMQPTRITNPNSRPFRG